MKIVAKQAIGYIIVSLIVACIIWFMMYKYAEKNSNEQAYNSITSTILNL